MVVRKTKTNTTLGKNFNPKKHEEELVEEIVKKFNALDYHYQLQILDRCGCGTEYFTCHCCGKVKRKADYYVSTETNCATGITAICKDCARDIAMPMVNGKRKEPNRITVDNALFALNKPFLDSVWESSMDEISDSTIGNLKSNVWASYIKNIQMKNYYTMTYRDSDNYNYSLPDTSLDELPRDKEIVEQFEKNKSDALRLLGYLPFDKEAMADQPFLYSQLIGFIDSTPEGNEDMMRTSSIISIVRGFLQNQKIDDMVAQLTEDPRNAEKNISTVKALQGMKMQVTQSITKLAEQSCISLKNSKNSSKGENTWTGKIKKIKDLNLREGQVNGFDIATCKGMQQVQEISDASIMKQLALDESEWSDMVATMRETNSDLRKERDAYKEINRLLLRENIDLKDYLEEQGFDLTGDTMNLRELYSVFSDKEEQEEESEVDDYEPDDSSV